MLAGIVLAVLVVGDVPVQHDHRASGVYDVECPLARLAVAAPRLSLSSVPVLACFERALELAPALDPSELTVGRQPSFDPRAPPIRTDLSARALTA